MKVEVLNRRQSYSKWRQECFYEVEVQFKDEPSAWIPEETYLAMNEKIQMAQSQQFNT
tara:strand:+ start:2833 stop:3006 length:174 start_codon:yes stop_codon:yes gene_type:complete